MANIFDLINEIRSGEIQIPEFQREFVWGNMKVRDLAESIYRGYPIGVLTLFKLSGNLMESQKAFFWALDGQQRLLSFNLIAGGSVPLREGWLKELWIWFNPTTDEFACTVPPRQRSDEWVNLSSFLEMGSEDFAKFLHSRSASEWDRIHKLWLQFQKYDVLVHILSEDFDLDRLGDIFVRINFSGTRVKGTDVYSTMVAVTIPGMVKELREFTDDLRDRMLGEEWDLDYGIIIRTFIAFLTNGRVKLASRVLDQARILRETLKEKKSSIQNIRQQTTESVEAAIDLLMDSSEFAINSNKHLPTQNVLVPMAYYLGKEDVSRKERRGLLAWFILASYFSRYSSAAETRLNEDLRIIEEGKGYSGLISTLELHEGDLKNRLKEDITRGSWNRLLLYAILRAKRAKDPISQQELTTNDIVVHHIFPKSILSDRTQDIDDIGNITLTTMNTNSTLSSQRPENYLQKITMMTKEDHLIPDDPDLWKIENYEKFLEERKKLLHDEIDNFWENYIT